MWIRAAVVLSCLASAGLAQGVAPPAFGGLPEPAAPGWSPDTPIRPHADIAASADAPDVAVMPLGPARPDAVGVLPTGVTGLPDDLWGASETAALARLFRAQPLQGLPAMQRFTQTLALAELAPPADSGPGGAALFLARLDMLLARGALDPAQALIDRTDPADPGIFRRRFDVALLMGAESRACAAMAATPDIAPAFAARIFCLARSGDWPAAALALAVGEALGRIPSDEARVIARFLDPEVFEGAPPLPPDPNPTPLMFRMRAALGERPDATGLPLAFARADLSAVAGWRAQLDAAERLVRSGAIEAAQWLDISTARAPSASGATWDRVGTLRAFDVAILAGDAAEVGRRMTPAWAAMRAAGLEPAFAAAYAEPLSRLPLTGEAGLLARRAVLLSPLYERVARGAAPQTGAERFAFAIARGLPAVPPPDGDVRARAVADAFAATPPDHRYRWFLRNDRLGEALLRAALVLSTPEADPGDLTDALALYREAGLEDVARRAALQLLLSG